jgi:hypothetical protein
VYLSFVDWREGPSSFAASSRGYVPWMNRRSPWPYLAVAFPLLILAILVSTYVWRTGGAIIACVGVVFAMIARLITVSRS